MVNAATNLHYDSQFFKEGAEIPIGIAKILELKDPSLLDNRIEINGRWIKIDSPIIKGFVEERKNSELRLKRYFKSVQVPIQPEIPILKSKKKKKK